MVNLIAGKEGSGKTKRIIQMANEAVGTSSGHIVFIDDDKRHMYELKHELRFVSMDEFPLDSTQEFFGFLCGLISNDYDIEKIYIDGLMKVMKGDIEEINQFVLKAKQISEQYNVELVTTLSYNVDDLPSPLKEITI